MSEYTASLLFIHLTFGVWANREELFLLRTAQKGIEKFSPFGQHVHLHLFQQEMACCPSRFRKKKKKNNSKTKHSSTQKKSAHIPVRTSGTTTILLAAGVSTQPSWLNLSCPAHVLSQSQSRGCHPLKC